jgi:ELWxxDGT repeat protein
MKKLLLTSLASFCLPFLFICHAQAYGASPESIISFGGIAPTEMVKIDSTVFFVNNDVGGNELWKSDGTSEGTVMVKDINGDGDSDPLYLTNVCGILFFSANDGTNGTELWRSDGTSEGTVMVKDINDGASSSPANLTLVILPITSINPFVDCQLFFSADDGTNGIELWQSDGTDLGTTMVKNIYPDSDNSSSPHNLIDVNGTLYFVATDDGADVSIWKSDGTVDGTIRQDNIHSGNDTVSNLTNVNGTLFFTADTYNDGESGIELWKTDGTGVSTSTSLVKDINTLEHDGSSPAGLTNINGTLFFSANDGTNGIELWKSDGTATGTVMVKDINDHGHDSSSPSYLTNVNGTVYFSASDGTNGIELWKSDGTSNGTVMVKDINSGAGDALPMALTSVNNRLYFRAGHNGAGGLYFTDGTDLTTTRIGGDSIERCPVVMLGVSSNLIYVDGYLAGLYKLNIKPNISFSTDSQSVWRGAGTATATITLSVPYDQEVVGGLTVTSVTATSTIDYDVAIEEYLIPAGQTTSTVPITIHSRTGFIENRYFTLNLVQPDPSNADDGAFLEQTITIFNNLSDYSLTSSWLSDVVVNDSVTPVYVGNNLFFSANDGTNGTELWKSDGTATGTVMVKNINSSGSSNPNNLTNVNGTLFFSASNGTSGYELWKSDGTTGGTALVKDINSGSGSSSPYNFVNVYGLSYSGISMSPTLFFTANDGTNGTELWRSDGTADGTVMVKDIYPSDSSNPTSLTNVNGTLFFTANDGINGTELWKSDGYGEGTSMVKNIKINGTSGTSSDSDPDLLININGTLFFTANDDTNGTELWRSDGTADGTVMVKDIYPSDSSNPTSLTNVNGTLFFTANDGTNGAELWKSDGTTSGTARVKDICSGEGSSYPQYLTNVNGTLFFIADDGSIGSELWKSDGTTGGTILIKDIVSGESTSDPFDLINVNDLLFFSANDGANYRQLWQSDGTANGTELTNIINNGVDSSFAKMVNGNGRLFSVVNNGSDYNLLLTDVASSTFSYSTSTQSVLEAGASVDVIITSEQGYRVGSATIDLGGTATEGVDYTIPTTTLDFVVGQTSTTVPITIIDNSSYNANKTIILTLSDLSGVESGTSTSQTITIVDDDPISISTSTSTLNITRGKDPISDSYTFRLTSQPSEDVTVALTLSNGNVGTLSPTSIIFTAETWSASQTVSLLPNNESVDTSATSANITFAFTSSDENYDGLAGTTTVNIINHFNTTTTTTGSGGSSGCTGLCGGGSTAVTNPTPIITIPVNPTVNQSGASEPIIAPTTANLPALLDDLGVAPNVIKEQEAKAKLSTDTKQLKVQASSEQLTAMANFVTYGITPETQNLGEGERRAVIRDYLDTQKTANINWSDIQRITTGQKPLNRNLKVEQQQVKTVLKIFTKITNQTKPDFTNPAQDLAWNTLLYRIRFERDQTKEKQAIITFNKLYKTTPKTPLDWAVVRALAYSGVNSK